MKDAILRSIAASHAQGFIREFCSFMEPERKVRCYWVTFDLILAALRELTARRTHPSFSVN